MRHLISRLHSLLHDQIKHIPILLFVFALSLRLVLIFALHTYSAPYHQSEHARIAGNILKGRGYTYDWYRLGDAGEGSFMPPPYVGVILAARLLFPSAPWLSIQIFQAFLSASTVVLIYYIGRETFNKYVGAIAAIVVAVYPPSLGYVLDIQSLIWETFWVSLVVAASIFWASSPTWRRAVLIGMAAGVAVLSRSNLILILPVLLTWMVLRYKRLGVEHFAITACAFSLILSPWIVRNYLVHKTFVLVSTNGGFNLFMGNNANANGSTYPDLSDLWRQYPELAKELAPLSEAERDRRLVQEAIAYIQLHPQEIAALALRKAFNFWWFRPSYIEGGIMDGYPWYYGLIYMVSYGVLIGLAVIGLILSLKRYRDLLIIYALCLIQTVVSMIVMSGARFRGILEPLMAIFAAYAIVWLLFRLTRLHQFSARWATPSSAAK